MPKGPSLDASVKSLAVHVEDHPLDYGTFEGTIPQGEYGGGTVMLWDRGTWEPEGDAAESYRRGKLVFRLDGERLKGRWASDPHGRQRPARTARTGCSRSSRTTRPVRVTTMTS